MPITSAILRVAQQHPERLAIAGEGRALTYAALIEQSRRTFAVVDELHAPHAPLAPLAARTGEAPGAAPEPGAAPRPAPETGGIPISAISVDSAFAAARFVASLAGYRAVSATIDPRWPLEHRVGVVLATGIGLIVSDSADLAAALAERDWGGTILTLDEFEDRERRAHPAPPPAARPGDEAFLLLFSSGTTSRPKAFLKTRRQYRENVAVSSAHLGPLPGVVTLAPGPVSYSLTLYAVIECLATGGSVHVADAFDPFAVAGRVRDAGVTRVVAVPAVVQALTDAARRDSEAFARLELVVTGGANLPAAIRDGLARVLPRVRLISYYGAAEIGFIGDSRGGDGTTISVYPGIEVSVRDAAGAPVRRGEAGALWVRAAACSDGYLAGTADELLRGEDGWATVHDQARLVDGGLEMLGRAGDVAVTGGHKVSLHEVDRAFAGAPGIAAAVAVALPHDALGSVVALVVEPEAGAAPDREALAARAAERLAPQFAPRRWYALQSLPRTVGGKVRRAEAAERVLDGSAVRL